MTGCVRIWQTAPAWWTYAGMMVASASVIVAPALLDVDKHQVASSTPLEVRNAILEP
jgi:hypothetical protein